MRRGVVVALLLALSLPASAAGKGDVAVTVCGTSGCAEVRGDASARQALAWPRLESVAPPPLGEFFLLRLGIVGLGERVAYYVPGEGLLAVIDDEGLQTGVAGVATWTAVPQAAATVLARAVAGLRPFPAPEVVGAEVAFEPVPDARGYERLFEVEPAAAAPTPPSDWQPVVLRADRANPWTDGTRLAYSPSTGVLRRGQELVPLPAALARDLAARDPLADGGRLPWPAAVAGGVAVAIVLAGVVLGVRAARRAPRRRFPAAT